MKEGGAKVTITRRGMHKGNCEFAIVIEDSLSGLRVAEIVMEPEEFAEAVTGMGMCRAEWRFSPTQFVADNIGKIRETMQVKCPKVNSYDKEEQTFAVEDHYQKGGFAKDGWMIHSDGTGSQQPGPEHRYLLYRFVEPGDA